VPSKNIRSPSSNHSDPLEEYLGRLAELTGRSDVSEGSYYGELKTLLESLGREQDIRVLPLPRPDENGAPDLRVTRGESHLVGYVEVKRPGANLEQIEVSPQLKRYRDGYPNLLLTDAYEFRLYRQSRNVLRVHLPQYWIGKTANRSAPKDGPNELGELLDAFFDFEPSPSRNARTLARQLARKARLLRNYTERLLERGDVPETQELRWLQKAARWFLLRELPPERFADLYAQTVTYGLFAARYWMGGDAGKSFDRYRAYQNVPRSLGLVRRLFHWVLSDEPPEEIRWIVDDLAQTLAATELREIFRLFYEEGAGKDPVLHFYETFLASYDPEKRERRGVFYTPSSVVGYIVRSASKILERDFGHEEGLAHPSVELLDLAAGTLTFVVEALRQAFASFRETRGRGTPPTVIRDELLTRFQAFELMVAPYVIGHLRIGMQLQELDCPLEGRQSFPFFLTDALQMEPPEQLDDEDMALLARDAFAALEIKKRTMDLPVIVGNPPYSGHSANRSPWIERSLRHGYERPAGPSDEGYYSVQGEPLGEKNPKWLQDDYVKFLRFAQWKIDQAGQGIVAFVTNHSYLDNPTFRGLRESLLGTFDRLYLLDLHGNAKKKERPPEGGRDDNVFDIRQGVAIALLVKKPGLQPGVFHHDLWGTEEEKRTWLEDHDVTDTPWREIEPRPSGFYFVPRDRDLEDRWRRFVAVDEIFEVRSLGVITGRDALVVDVDEDELHRRMSHFCNPQSPRGAEAVALRHKIPDTRSWSLESAWRQASRDPLWRQRILPFLVRPFDRRWIFYAPYLVERPRQEVMHHLGSEDGVRRRGPWQTSDNVALLVTRQAKRQPGAFVTRDLTGHKVLDSYDGNYVFPLYLLPPENLLPAEELRQPNLDAELLRHLQNHYGETVAPEPLLGYLYAVLASDRYRDTYRQLLATGFPRIPFPRSCDLFRRLAEVGWELVQTHLLSSGRLDEKDVRVSFEGVGDGRVGKTRQTAWNYRPEEERLYLNDDLQYLTPISGEVWDYRVGAYRVLAHWLDARRGLRLRADDIRHLCRTAAALRESLRLQRDIEAIYPAVEADPLPPVPRS